MDKNTPNTSTYGKQGNTNSKSGHSKNKHSLSSQKNKQQISVGQNN